MRGALTSTVFIYMHDAYIEAKMTDQHHTSMMASEPTAGRALMRIVKRYPGRLSLTGGLVISENALELL